VSDKWDKWYYFKRAAPEPSSTATAQGSPFDVLFPLAGIALLVAIGVVAWQIYTYLRVGAWPSLSVVTALQWLTIEWALFPRDWLGVHNVLSAFPLSLAILVIGWGPLFMYVHWADKGK
jgi:hypothetical protein